MPQICVAIPYYNREQQVELTFPQLRAAINLCPAGSIEFVVADDGSRVPAPDFGQTSILVRPRGSAPRNGAVARNVIIRHTECPYLLFTDPEIWHQPADFLSRLLTMVQGEHHPSFWRVWGGKQSGSMARSRRDLAQTPACIVPDVLPVPLDIDLAAGPWRSMHYGLLAPTAVLREVRGYDESWVRWGLEDADMYYRLIRGCGLCDVRLEWWVVYHVWHTRTECDYLFSFEERDKAFSGFPVQRNEGRKWGHCDGSL